MPKLRIASAAALLFFSQAAYANELSDAGVVIVDVSSGLTLAFKPKEIPRGTNSVAISVAGPSDYEAKEEYGDALPRLFLKEYGDVLDGWYNFEVSGATGEKIKLQSPLKNGRDAVSEVRYVTFSIAGSFLVDRGEIVKFDPDALDKTEPVKGTNEPSKDSDTGDEGKPSDGRGGDGKPPSMGDADEANK